MKQATKKLYEGHYFHIDTKKHIVSWKGDNYTIWNIWNDETLCDEFKLGFDTKRQAIDYLNKHINL